MSIATNAVEWELVSEPVDAPAYRGPDRRRASSLGATTRWSTTSVGVFLLASQAIVLASAWQGSWSTSGSAGPVAWLTASVAVIAGLVALIFAIRWRLTGDASDLWVATALFVYAATNVAFPGLVSSFADTGSHAGSVARLLRPVSVFVVIGLLTIAVVAPSVDARLTIRRVLAIAGAMASVGFILAATSTDFRVLLGPALDRVPSGASGGAGQVGIGVIWLCLAVAFARRSSKEGRSSTQWLAVMLIGLAEARLGLALAVRGDPAWMLASQLARLFGVTAALVGAMQQLQLTFARQQSTLLDSLVELGSTRARRRAELASAEERTHDIRSALAGMGGAAVTLERYHDQLTEEERRELAQAVTAEIVRLQEIFSDNRREVASFAWADALRPVIACAVAQGTIVAVDDLVVFGRRSELAEAFQNLLDNARRHAPGSPVDASAKSTNDRIELRVEDRGPGVPADMRQLIFERGWRGQDDVEGSGLGLYVAARLVRDQGGDLHVEERAGGGASFVMTLVPEGEASQ